MNILKSINTDILIPIIVTVVSGVFVFIIGEILSSIWLIPLQQFKDLRKRIMYALSFYANIYTNVVDYADYKDKQDDNFYIEHINASDEIRKLASELNGYIETLSWFKPGIPKKKYLKEAAEELFFISNSFFTPYDDKSGIYSQCVENHNSAEKVKSLLCCYKLKTDKKKKKRGDSNEV